MKQTHFVGEETEVQGGSVTCPELQKNQWQQGSNPALLLISGPNCYSRWVGE